MYLEFYGFRERPFRLTPDPRFIFLSKNHREAFAHLLYGIDNRVGFISLTGEVGSGKTTVLRTLLSQLDPDRHRTALIFNPCLSASELLQNINRELGIPPCPPHRPSPLEALNLFLLQQNGEGRTVVLVIDEAQDLESAVLEQIRLISNLETDSEKLIQIVLSGQPELTEILERKEMRQISQRITVRYHLQPMDFEDTIRYINHRLLAAGGKGASVFSKWALRRIYRYSRGLPRLINAACDRALLAGYAREVARIGLGIAHVAIKEIRSNGATSARKPRFVLVPVLVILAAVLAMAVSVNWPGIISRFKADLPIDAKERETKKETSISTAESSHAMAAEIWKVSESESARNAFNRLAGLWNVMPVPENTDLKEFNGMEKAARERKLRLHRFSGSLGNLLRIDYPAVLVLTLPAMPGKRFASLVGIEKGQVLVELPILGRKSLSFSELEEHWSGQAFLPWKDPLNLLPALSGGPRGEHVKGLQGLLKEAGAFSGPLSGVYDGDTHSAVKQFQSSKGIKPDGIAGDQTLMILYRSVGRFEVPTLAGGQK